MVYHKDNKGTANEVISHRLLKTGVGAEDVSSRSRRTAKEGRREMRIFNEQNGKTVATIITNHSMTLDDAIRLVGGTIHEEANGFDENVEIRGEWYCYDDLNMDFADENRYKVREAYVERWYWNAEPDVVEEVQRDGMDLEEIERLAEGWGVSVNELLRQVESI